MLNLRRRSDQQLALEGSLAAREIHNNADFAPKLETQSLYFLYNSLFECVVADTEALIDECYKLRYQVYCLENQFEAPDPEKGEYERDEYDGHSIHALLRYRQTGEYIGTARLIMNEEDSPKRIPAFDICDDHGIQLPNHLYNAPCAEISRFCISKNFRRRVTDNMVTSAYSARELADMRMRIIPCMAVGLMAMVFKLCANNDIHQACAVVEPSLIRMLDKLGIHFKHVGAPIEYHGARQVTYILDHELMESLRQERPDVHELMVKLL